MEGVERFLDGQRFGYDTALAEMKQGEKRNHWIWYIFPQVKGLGHSPNAQYYGIKDLEEAKAYLQHPVLGPRLWEITRAVLSHKGKDIYDIMGSRIDAMKLKSSMTLFDLVAPDDVFAEVIDAFYDGIRDARTINLVKKADDKV